MGITMAMSGKKKQLTRRTCTPWPWHRRRVPPRQQAPRSQLQGWRIQTQPSSLVKTNLFYVLSLLRFGTEWPAIYEWQYLLTSHLVFVHNTFHISVRENVICARNQCNWKCFRQPIQQWSLWRIVPTSQTSQRPRRSSIQEFKDSLETGLGKVNCICKRGLQMWLLAPHSETHPIPSHL